DLVWTVRTARDERRLVALDHAGEFLARVADRWSDPGDLASESQDAANALKLLVDALDARDASVREAAIDALAASGTRYPGYEFRLAARLDDDAARVRAAALRALA